ncbi:MBOAT family protein [Pseudoduganella sp. DS3]|uniref:Probable alginate O-acetylase AlgI n=1 Tax=Pseudoduganella guangdongensis TaxID=2692179 RepID=A0A6N9HPU7_9BURK|nr:MBOAT family protein [Pseudoduganella guangdongensis]MYN05263.1 MBOAT family protein [Pseudoduganella guangdongensis]
MIFSSVTFLFYFLPCFLALYYLLPWKNAVLLVGSLVFYAWGEPRFVPLLMLSALLNYGFGYAISRAQAPRTRQLYMWLGIGINLAALLYYKYAGFFAQSWNSVAANWGGNVAIPEIVLPLGISFVTFQGISYLIDIYRRDIPAQSSLLRFAMYKAMFPQLIAGPIVRYSQIADEISQRVISNERIWRGVQQFVLGLAQKVLIANSVALAADRIFAIEPDQLSTLTAWIGMACYSVQILYDFAGYSNMAIGLAHMLGFTYPPNFNRPYAAQSITQFWRRWHISLSSWFRDYLYIPLGGNRAAPWRTYFNLALVFVLCGLWHGAAWTFVLWGVWHGALLVIERVGLGKLLERLPGVVVHAYTLLAVMFGWVLFRADTVGQAAGYMRTLLGMSNGSQQWQMLAGPSTMWALAIGLLLAVLPDGFLQKTLHRPAFAPVKAASRRILMPTAFAMCLLSLAADTYNPFIYFRF